MKLTFYGGARSVTGSNYMLESGGVKILIDCGLHQGSNFAERQNFEPFPYNVKDVTAACITHAHIDHTGRLPKLYGDGFRGKIYSTPPTRNFAEFLLIDSQNLLCREAEREKKKYICSTEAVKEVMGLWEGRHYHEPFEIGPFRIEFFDAGHILGSAIISVEAEGKRVIFSGDLGNYPAPIIKPTELINRADYCLIESTYGDRIHEDVDRRREFLEDAIEDTVHAGGTLMIPSFAMERTQELLFHLDELVEHGRIPRVPIFVDSPLAIKLTQVYKKYENYFNKEVHDLVQSGDDILNFPGLRFTLATAQSKEIAHVKPPKVVIAGSGMSNGGRILHHEKQYFPDPKSMILFIGFQARGSLGRRVLEGAKEVKIFGEKIPVLCKRRRISGYSAHADQNQLMWWISQMKTSLKTAFIVQGEEEASEALAQRVQDELAIKTVIPNGGEEVVL